MKVASAPELATLGFGIAAVLVAARSPPEKRARDMPSLAGGDGVTIGTLQRSALRAEAARRGAASSSAHFHGAATALDRKLRRESTSAAIRVAGIERRIGLPTVRIEVDFSAVSRLDDSLVLSLAVERLGKRSLTLSMRCEGADRALRVALRQVIVTTSLESHRSIDIPHDVRAAIAACTAAG